MLSIRAKPSSLFDGIDSLVDQRVGIIRHVTEDARQAGEPDFFHFVAQACNTRAFNEQKNFSDAGGASANREVAMAKAIGEAIERYCPAVYQRDALPLSSFERAWFPCIPPKDFALYSAAQHQDKQFPFVKFTERTKVRWAKMLDLTCGKPCYAPASMIYLPYISDSERGEEKVVQTISTGLACHSTFAEAAVSAICEVVERDSFTITWQAMMQAPAIRIETLSEENRDLTHRFERIGSRVRVLDLTLDHGIPSILSILSSTLPHTPAFVFAASCDPSPEKAVRKSLEELAHTRRLAMQLLSIYPRFTPAHDYSNINTQDFHVRMYGDVTTSPLIQFLFTGSKWVDFHGITDLSGLDADKVLHRLVAKLAAVGHRVLIADLTTPDIKDLTISVVRAVIPGFHPLFMGYRFRALGGTRLWNVPHKLGFSGITKKTGDNPAPHPYP